MFVDTYRMSPSYVMKFEGTHDEKQINASRQFFKSWHNLKSNTSLSRFNRHEWEKTFKAIDDLQLADELEKSNQNLEINLEIF